MRRRMMVLAACTLLVGGCSALGVLRELVQAPRFTTVSGRNAEFRLSGPSAGRPLGGATIRLWARVDNPNSFGFTLSRLAGSLFLENTEAARVNFPLGLPLVAQGDTIIPLDISVSFSDLPNLAGVAQRALTGAPLAYRLNGTVSVDAGPLGQPSFGPTTLLQGEVRPLR